MNGGKRELNYERDEKEIRRALKNTSNKLSIYGQAKLISKIAYAAKNRIGSESCYCSVDKNGIRTRKKECLNCVIKRIEINEEIYKVLDLSLAFSNHREDFKKLILRRDVDFINLLDDNDKAFIILNTRQDKPALVKEILNKGLDAFIREEIRTYTRSKFNRIQKFYENIQNDSDDYSLRSLQFLFGYRI